MSHPKPEPKSDVGPIGGQALLEGVMMRRGECWGAAVRRPDGSIATTQHQLPAGLGKWRRIPLVRGVLALGETTGLGTKAMVWAARERAADGADPEEAFSKTGLALSTIVALVLAIGIFGVLPAAVIKMLGIHGRLLFSLAEGALRLAILLAYSALLAASPQVRRVFGYHGAEHMTIHAFEHSVALEPATIRAFDRRHPRCGTSFLLVVVAVTVLAHAAVGNPSWPLLVASRILLLPLVAGLAFEAIRFASRHDTTWYGRILMAPGLLMQGLTTREPDDDQIVVAIAALKATLEVSPAPVKAPTGAVAAA